MRTKNYLGKRDENRGIIIFCIVFVIVAFVCAIAVLMSNNGKEKKGTYAIDSMQDIQKSLVEINTFKIEENKLVLEGDLNEGISENILSKLNSVQIVLKTINSDVYEFDTDYYVSDDGIKFSTLAEDTKISTINLDEIQKGEYFVFLRIKYSSQSSENGYNCRYYTFENLTEKNEITYNNFSIKFGESNNFTSYLSIK